MKITSLIVAIICMTGCTLFSVSQRDIKKSERIWNASGIKNYNYTFIIGSLNRDRECSTPKVGIEVEVRDGKLKKFGTCEPSVDKASRFGTIDRIFDTLHRERADSPPEMAVRFDKKYGYPEYVDINYSRWLTDHRVQYHVQDFVIVE
jgi:hypothetical protein